MTIQIGALKKYKPITPSMRHTVLVDKSKLERTISKFLTTDYRNNSGRNNTGSITVRHKGSYTKRKYRLVDHHYNQYNVPGEVRSIEYDPMRSAFISLIQYDNGLYTYKLNTHLVKVGQVISTTPNVRFEAGQSSELRYIPEGSLIHSIELRPDRGASIARSAGMYGMLLSKSGDRATIKLPSKQIKEVSIYCKATIGTVSNIYHRDQVLGKAGRSIRLGRRPKVRGVAMNPVDHPHGGGEGKRSNKKEVFNYTGHVTRGTKTSRSYKHKHIVSKINKIYL